MIQKSCAGDYVVCGVPLAASCPGIDIHRIVRGRSESERGAQGTVRHSKTRRIGFGGNPLSLQFDAAQAPGKLETRPVELRQALLTAQHR